MNVSKVFLASGIVASLLLPLSFATPTLAGSKTAKVLAVATQVSNAAKKASAAAVKVAPNNPYVVLIDANIKIYSKIGCQLGSLVYGTGC